MDIYFYICITFKLYNYINICANQKTVDNSFRKNKACFFVIVVHFYWKYMYTKKGKTKRFISHVYMWIIAIFGVALAFIFVPAGILLYKKNINISFLAIILTIFLFIFLVYYIPSAIWERKKFRLYSASEMRRMIQLGVYGKCVHPTCTTLAFLGWIFFFIFPDLRIFLSAVWFSMILIFWMKVEKSFFLGRRSKFETQEDSGPG
ncbi:MAG: hypothetical protein US30_C0004G0089 [Candidatus Moranbacteria bacterium GW2011_GWF2_36_839]|nr:MAG: hypothetical protein US27_C0002G0092 [Candidatus Moranbacteria bacterium GW2011_GWF1_36_78]KKQ17345.1 MAG: hypothetical protein US30_C0004G0089 [Candidatus Moranbacteria bacterium GW2011_GWF2_36_839]